ncbi:hypothetical protein COLO4_38030 [Corchorus olitorius]|uniref:Uncharacterized protein n=1 Tax=Corchorus olitorius TaxID=93759 RepID=A0A1R3FXT1_9ROSI|nr:hypothetical protein COLO4_38030 [Corchorus olitorius]
MAFTAGPRLLSLIAPSDKPSRSDFFKPSRNTKISTERSSPKPSSTNSGQLLAKMGEWVPSLEN